MNVPDGLYCCEKLKLIRGFALFCPCGRRAEVRDMGMRISKER